MLDEAEWADLAPLIRKLPQSIKLHRETTGSWPDKAKVKEFERAALDRYEQMTGFPETNVNALWHHRLSELGPPCSACGKPLRTQVARFCAECGHAV